MIYAQKRRQQGKVCGAKNWWGTGVSHIFKSNPNPIPQRDCPDKGWGMGLTVYTKQSTASFGTSVCRCSSKREMEPRGRLLYASPRSWSSWAADGILSITTIFCQNWGIKWENLVRKSFWQQDTHLLTLVIKISSCCHQMSLYAIIKFTGSSPVHHNNHHR